MNVHYISMFFVDSGYQLVLLVFLTDKNNRVHFIHRSLSKCQLVSTGILAGETYAFYQGYDPGYLSKYLVIKMGNATPIFLFTDFKSFFDTITRSRRL